MKLSNFILTHSFPTFPFFTPWKHPKTHRIFDNWSFFFIKGYRKRTLGRNGLNQLHWSICSCITFYIKISLTCISVINLLKNVLVLFTTSNHQAWFFSEFFKIFSKSVWNEVLNFYLISVNFLYYKFPTDFLNFHLDYTASI